MKKILFAFCLLFLQNVLLAQQFQMVSSLTGIGNTVLSMAHDSEYVLSYAYNYGFRIDTFSRSGQFISGKNYQRANSEFPVFSGFKRDSSGNTYAFGSSNYLPATSSDHSAIIYKLDSNGIIVWSQYAHTSYLEDGFQDIFVSPSGAIYAAGTGTPTGDYTSQMVVKYSSTGQPLFSKIYTSQCQYNWYHDYPMRICAVNDTELFVLGTFTSQVGEFSIFITNIDTLGNPRWTKFIPGFLSLQDIAINDTSIYITGVTHLNDVFLMNVNFSGNVNWSKEYGTPSDDNGQVCTIKKNGNLLIGGNTNVTNQQYDAFFLMEVDKDGNQISCKYHQVASRNCNFLDIVERDSSGNFAALGVERSVTSSSIYFEADKPNGLSGCNETNFSFNEELKFPHSYDCVLRVSSALSYGTSYNLVMTTPVSIFSGMACSSNCNVNSNMILSQRKLCYGDSLVLNAADTSLVLYSWYLNDSLVGNNYSLHLSMMISGLDSIKLIVSNGICTDSSVQYVTVKEFPVAQFSLLRQYHLLSFTNTSLSDDYVTWNFSDGTTSTDDFFKYNFKDTGFVYLQQNAYNVCGMDSLIARVLVNDSTESNFSKAYYTPSYSVSMNDFVMCADGGVVGVGTNSISKTTLIGIPLWASIGGWSLDRIVETYDLGFFCGNSINSSGNFHFVKLDSLGNFVWAVDGAQSGSIGDVIELPNHDLIAAGSVGPSISADAFVMCMDEHGAVKWYYTYWAMERVRKLLVNSDGIYAIGQLFNDVAIMKLDFDGMVSWSMNYGDTPPDDAKDAAFLTPNKIVTYGITKSYTVDENLWLICTDTLGNVLWSKIIGTPTTDNPTSMVCINGKILISFGTTLTSNFTFILDSTGTQIGGIENSWNLLHPFILETQSNYEGQLITLGSNVGNYDYFLQKVNIDSTLSSCFNSLYTLPATTVSLVGVPGWTTGSVVSAIRSYGYIQNSLSIVDSAYCSTDNCSQQANFNYMFSGDSIHFTNTTTGLITNVLWDFGDGQQSTQNNPSHIYWFPGQYTVCLYAFSVCNIDTFCQTVNVIITANPVTDDKLNFSAWPNPANDVLNLKFNNNSIETVNIIDSRGATILSFDNSNKISSTIDISNLADGIYFILARNTDGLVSGQKIIVNKN